MTKPQTLTIGFDVYGTLIDTHGVVVQLESMIGSEAKSFSQMWREKQLEYTFRRGLMGQYQHFGICTRQALEFTDTFLGTGLSEEQRDTLISAYASLPAFDDVADGLARLSQSGHRLLAFSNGQGSAVKAVLDNADIADRFEGIVSVDEIGTFKPNPAVYRHFADSTGSTMESCWLVSSNGFDVIGAVATGMKAAWIQRSQSMVFDPWEFQPSVVLQSLADLPEAIQAGE